MSAIEMSTVCLLLVLIFNRIGLLAQCPSDQLISVFVLLWTAHCHIGRPCNAILGVCLPINSHIYCDDKKVCRCRKEYPIVVGAHTCLAPKRNLERCSHPEECLYWDKNAFCNQSPYASRCECKGGFSYDNNQRLCVQGLTTFAINYLLMPSLLLKKLRDHPILLL